jgi:hypothetical protein
MLILIGGPATGKTTLAKLVVRMARSRGIRVTHLDDKNELVRLCRTAGRQDVDYGVDERGVISWVSENILARRVAMLAKRIKRLVARLDAVVVEFCGLHYEEELRPIVAPIPWSCRRIVILRESLAVTMARNEQRSGLRWHGRAVPADFVRAYAESREENEGAVSKDATIVDCVWDIHALASELAIWLSPSTHEEDPGNLWTS